MEQEPVVEIELTTRERAAIIAVLRYSQIGGDESHLKFNELWDALAHDLPEDDFQVLPLNGSPVKMSFTTWETSVLRGMFTRPGMPGPLSRELHSLHTTLLALEKDLEQFHGENLQNAQNAPTASERTVV